MIADPLHRLLAQTEARPDHPAVVDGSRTVTYGEFGSLVRRLAGAIGEAGPSPRVLIQLPQGSDAYAAMFATLMAGGYYATINLDGPAKRHELVFARFAPDVVVSKRSLAEPPDLAGSRAGLIDIDAPLADEAPAPAEPHDLAYVMFTSGSTGEPKGVMIRRDGLAHYAAWATRAMQVTADDRWSQHPNIAFDLSVLDIYGALCAGATLYPLNTAKDRLMPAEAIRRNRLTIWDSVPSVVDLMLRAEQMTADHLASLRLMTFCGEPLLPRHLEAIFAARPDITVHNTYGPTEATVSCTLIKLTQECFRAACEESAALGAPIDGMELHLVGGDGPDEGEIALAGPQVASGYWQDEQETAAKFRTMALGGAPRRIYLTGDWAKRENRRLFFQNRIDMQVKIRGHRVELGEIDAALRDCGIESPCTIFVRGELHSFIEGGRPDLAVLRAGLAERLPDYELPAAFHLLDRFPRNPNDKIDTRRLAQLVEAPRRVGGNGPAKGNAT